MADVTIRLHATDNLVIALTDLGKGAAVPGVSVALPGPVPRGHKLATRAIARGEIVLRYGQSIGQATEDIPAGGHIHSHNLGMGPHSSDYAIGAESKPLPPLEPRMFMGYDRPDGTVGTRNYLGILTSVNCSGSVARFIAEAAEKDPVLAAMPGIDGIVPIVHGTGCGMSGKGEGYETLFRTIAGYGHNPNFGAILMVGLGCEVMQIGDLVDRQALKDSARFRYMTIQQTGGTRATVDKGLALLRELAAEFAQPGAGDTPVPKLVLGMQCGGSDGYSGITANPALGIASDLLVAQGASRSCPKRRKSTAPSTC